MFLELLLALCALLVVYIKWNYSYWQRRGFPYLEPKIPFGVLDSVRRKERSFGLAIYDAYVSSREKVLGIYLLTRPALLIRDAQLARDVLTKDFSSFHDRGVYVDEENDPMSCGLFFLKGRKWKNMRTKLAPSFTSGKLKAMFETIDDVSCRMIEHLNNTASADGSVEVEGKRFFSTYAIDISASVIFGLEVDSFKNPKNDFHRVSHTVNAPTLSTLIRGTCQFLYPTLEKFFIRIGWEETGPHFMKNIVRQTVEYREKNNVSRRDLLQLLLQLRNGGKINENDEMWTFDAQSKQQKNMSVEEIAGQMFLFYVAGYETTASSVAFTLYELSQYPELLARAQKEVDEVLQKHGRLSYEAIEDLKFMHLCFEETIRKYPALPILNRECTEDFTIPDTGLVIKKGTPIIISLLGLHRDPEYFNDPLRYNPDRFSEENMNYDPVAYLPFGGGPRICIAQRLGKLNVKMALAKILSNFDVEIRKERREIEFSVYGITIIPKDGVPIRLIKRKKTQVVC